MTRNHIGKRRLVGAFLVLFITCVSGIPQQPGAASPHGNLADARTGSPQADDAPTMFPHTEDSRFYIAGQANIIFQAHGPFHSPYEGTNSLLARGEYKPSLLGTLYLGAQLRRDPKNETDAIFN